MSMQVMIDVVIHYGGLALLHGTVLALATWVLSALFRHRMRPALQAALWTVALIKFLLPPILPGEMALSSWINQVITPTIAEPLMAAATSVPFVGGQISGSSTESSWRVGITLLFICYLLVVTLLSIRLARTRTRTRRHLRALPLAREDVRAEVTALAAMTRLKYPPEVRVTDERTTFYVLGFRRAVLVLPEGLMKLLEPAERRAFILHELAHLHRRDQLIRWLQSLACILLFFFPPVRWICRRIEHFTEIACDKWAVAISGIEPHVYAAALVGVVKELYGQPQTETGLHLLPGVRRLRARLQAVLQNDLAKPAQISPAARLVVAVWALFALGGGSVMEARKTSAPLQKATAEIAEAPRQRMSAVAGVTETGTAPKRSANFSHRQATQYAKRDRDRERPDNLSDEPRVDEPQIQQKMQQPNIPLSHYEVGFLLGKRYSEERKMRLASGEEIGPDSLTSDLTSELNTKRAIELRMRELSGRRPDR
jgi:beta-lactamase regulating signal transducer with metallopeptidase domain